MNSESSTVHESSGDSNPHRCLQCDHPLQQGQDVCIECGAAAEWSRGAYALRAASARSLPSIRRGAGLLALGWVMLFAIPVGVIATKAIIGQGLATPGQRLFSVLMAMILGLFLAGAFQLRPKVRSKLDVMLRPLNSGFIEIVVGVVMAGAPLVLELGLAAAEAMNLPMTIPRGMTDGRFMVMFWGLVVCGLGCRNIARTYLRQLRDEPPLKSGSRRLVDRVLLAVVAFILAWCLVLLAQWLYPDGLAGRQFMMIAPAILPLLVLLLMLAGAVGMFRLWHGVGKLLKSNQRAAGG